MPYTHVTRTAHGAEALKYIFGDGKKGHNGATVRNEYVTGINMLPNNVVPFCDQMQMFWYKADPRHTIQIDRYILSFSANELDPHNPGDIAKAHYIGCAFAEKIAPGHQVMVATQTDGKGGLIHVHMAVNDVNMITLKGLPSGRYLHAHVRQLADQLCQNYFDLDIKEMAPEKISRTVRAKLEKNKVANQTVEYIWMEDLKERIRAAAIKSYNEDQFIRNCRDQGVEVEKRKATRTQPEYYLYELTDVSKFGNGKIPKNLKSKSYKMGANYQPSGITQMMAKQQTITDHIKTEASSEQKNTPTESKIGQQTLDAAKIAAQKYAAHLYDQYYHNGAEPKLSIAEKLERKKLRDRYWQNFTQWRTQQQKSGNKLPAIYQKNKLGEITFRTDELTKQYLAFLDQQSQQKRIITQKAKAPRITSSKAIQEERKINQWKAILRSEASEDDQDTDDFQKA